MRRARLALLVLVVLLVGAAGAVLWLEGPRLAEHAIRYGAGVLGYRDVRVGVTAIRPRRIEIEHFSAGPAPGLSAEAITVAWTGRHLLAGRVASVEVGSAVLHGTWTEDGVAFPVLPPAEEEGPWLAPPVWDRVRLATARVELAGGEAGPVTVRLRDVDLGAPPGERLRARGEATVAREAGDLTGELEVFLDGDAVSGHGRVTSEEGDLTLALDLGEPRPPPGRFPEIAGPEDLTLEGRIEIDAEDADLSPLTPSLTADGAIAFRLAEGHLRVEGDGLTLTGFGMAVSGLGLTVELAQLDPPAAPRGQTIRVGSIDAGMDLGGGSLRFGVEPGGVLDIEGLEWSFQGGGLSTQGRFDPFAERNALVLAIRDLDLARLVGELERTDLAVTGTLSGSLPVRIDGDRIFADDGRLIAGGEGGVIRYQQGGLPPPGLEDEPAPPPESGRVGGSQLVLDALRNFHYRTLEVGVGGELTGEMVLRIEIEGSNPDVYDGYPFQLNLNLEGPLADVVQGSTTGFRIQDAVEERFQQRGGKR